MNALRIRATLGTRNLGLDSHPIVFQQSPLIFLSIEKATTAARHRHWHCSLRKTPNMTITYAILKEQNATTSNAIIEHYESNTSFQKLSKFEGDSTIQRDREDDIKLAKGIAFAQKKGVLDPHHVPQPYTEIDVLGKTPQDVAQIIMNQISGASSKGKGSVIVLCGLSGTGKVMISTIYKDEMTLFQSHDISATIYSHRRTTRIFLRAQPFLSYKACLKSQVKRWCVGPTETFFAP